MVMYDMVAKWNQSRYNSTLPLYDMIIYSDISNGHGCEDLSLMLEA